MNYFITGIGTGVGKSVVSAIVVQALGADYWKPIQAGIESDGDTKVVQRLVSNNSSQFHKEAYVLTQPLSPHAAARIDGVEIDLEEINLPGTPRPLVIEGVGGFLSPINETYTNADLALRFGAQILLVSQHYLGSINHTLLTFEALRSRELPIAGIVFNKTPLPDSEALIIEKTKLPVLLRIEDEPVIDKATIGNYAAQLRSLWT